MDLPEFHRRGLVNDRTAAIMAMIDSGWSDDEAGAVLDRIEDAAVSNRPRKWQRWTDGELAELDKVISQAGGKVPGMAVTVPLSRELGRAHKSVLSAIERRIVKGGAT